MKRAVAAAAPPLPRSHKLAALFVDGGGSGAAAGGADRCGRAKWNASTAFMMLDTSAQATDAASEWFWSGAKPCGCGFSSGSSCRPKFSSASLSSGAVVADEVVPTKGANHTFQRRGEA